jgi:hypothetical protein
MKTDRGGLMPRKIKTRPDARNPFVTWRHSIGKDDENI